MRIDILTIFPEMFGETIHSSILGRAEEKGLLEFHTHNIRDYSLNKHHNTDDYPYGGGAGMVMLAQPIFDCVEAVSAQSEVKPRCIYMGPRGKRLSTELAKELALEERLLILAGHYEGIDERVIDEIVTDRISIGDYVLTGGELSALVVMDAVSRLIPGVLKNDESAETESFNTGGLLEYPQYTRPDEWHGKKVPDILLSGDHGKVDNYRMHEMRRVTKEIRPDLYMKYIKDRGIN